MKQTDVEKVHRLVVAPLTRIWKSKPTQEETEDYVRYLAGYSEETLAAAMHEVVQTCKTPPRIAHIVEACRNAGGSRQLDAASSAESFLDGCRKREEQARRMAREFVERFTLNDQAKLARSEGWESKLMAYVYEAAWLQAQHICGVRNPGFSQGPVTTHDLTNHRQQCRDFVTSCKRQADTGRIDVAPPDYLVAGWRGVEERRAA